MLSEEVLSKLRRLMELRERRDELKTAATNAENEYRDMEADVFEALDNGPVRRVNNVDLGPPWGKVSFGARETYFGKVIKGMESEAIGYFKRTGQEDAMTEPKLVPKRLNEEVRQRIEDGEELPPGIDFYVRRGVTITRQKD